MGFPPESKPWFLDFPATKPGFSRKASLLWVVIRPWVSRSCYTVSGPSIGWRCWCERTRILDSQSFVFMRVFLLIADVSTTLLHCIPHASPKVQPIERPLLLCRACVLWNFSLAHRLDRLKISKEVLHLGTDRFGERCAGGWVNALLKKRLSIADVWHERDRCLVAVHMSEW